MKCDESLCNTGKFIRSLSFSYNWHRAQTPSYYSVCIREAHMWDNITVVLSNFCWLHFVREGLCSLYETWEPQLAAAVRPKLWHWCWVQGWHLGTFVAVPVRTRGLAPRLLQAAWGCTYSPVAEEQRRLAEVIARVHKKNGQTHEVLKWFESPLNSPVPGQCKPMLFILTLITFTDY